MGVGVGDALTGAQPPSLAAPGYVADTVNTKDYNEAASAARRNCQHPPDRCAQLNKSLRESPAFPQTPMGSGVGMGRFRENQGRYSPDRVKANQKAGLKKEQSGEMNMSGWNMSKF